MGAEQILRQSLSKAAPRGPTLVEQWAKQDAEHRAKEARAIEDARADAKAVWLLADMMLPADVKELAQRWGMPETLVEIWRNAFITGWRAAHRKTEP
jgi:hypothetical protein